MTPRAWGDGPFIADKSAFVRGLRIDSLHADWLEAVEAREIVTSTVTRYEILHSARNLAEFDEWADVLDLLRDLRITDGICKSAAAGMRDLAATPGLDHRHVPIPDYLIAATAQEHGIGVLHYDHHFDTLATVFEFESRWIAPPGSIP